MSHGCARREVTDPIRPSYPVDLAVKSLPLCILEHCWSLQIIRNTRGVYSFTACSTHHLFLLSLPPPHLLILLHQQGHTHSWGLICACVCGRIGECIRRRGKLVTLVGFVLFFIMFDSIIGCSVWKSWRDVLFRWALRCKELWDALLMKCLGNEVLSVDQYHITCWKN